jgi:hypothetical protein
MADGIIYLDIDDEITSAAARIRATGGQRLAVVLPYGSRVATSRINFRLLARDALAHEKRLSIVAGEAATRALAASAGLPVFTSVAEYESAIAAEVASSEPDGDAAPGGASAGAAMVGTAAGAAALATTRDDPASVPETAASVPPGDAGSGPAVQAGAETSEAVAPTVIPPDPVTSTRDDATAYAPVARVADGVGPSVAPPAARPARRRIDRTPVIVGAALLALAVVVGGVAAFLVLPSATAVVTPREESIGPVALRISASTEVDQPDVEAGIVPAEVIEVDVEAQDTFPATGVRVEETAATGTVRFVNLDPTSSNSIAKGAEVSTSAGIRFRTDAKVTVPAAELVFDPDAGKFTVEPATETVKVTAVDAGPDGNVAANAITVTPRGEGPLFLKVSNPDPTTGGARQEFLRVTQEDVDAALAALQGQLDAAFADRLDDADLAGGEATVFPETAELGAATANVDPETLVGTEADTFDLGASATGTVTAVDAAPVRLIAEARLEATVDPGHQLVQGSSEITESPAVVDGDTITYPVVATARQVAILDPIELEAQILGKPVDEARDTLGAYGDVLLEVWPDWVATIPSLDARVEVTVEGPTTQTPTGAPSDAAP